MKQEGHARKRSSQGAVGHPENFAFDAEWRREPEEIHPGLPPPWHAYAAGLHERLLRRWSGSLPPDTLVLKTDLFEEGLSSESPAARIAALGWRPAGIDIGLRIVRRAVRHVPALGAPPRAAIADVRRLPFKDGSIPAIFSNSTLDHFPSSNDFERALRELHRVLRPGGRLLLTLDNPVHPLIGMRNALPRSLTNKLGITHFYVGHTLSQRKACRTLRAIGFDVLAAGTFMHAVRYLTLPLLRLTAGRQILGNSLVRALNAAEALARLPTAQFTGHFIFVDARKSTE